MRAAARTHEGRAIVRETLEDLVGWQPSMILATACDDASYPKIDQRVEIRSSAIVDQCL
jgi:hypothetical protein